MLQLVNAGHKSLADYATIATRGLMDEIRRLAEPLAGQARRPPLGDGVRRRRRGDQLHADSADAGRRAPDRVADHQGRGGVLERHEDDPQRAPGKPAGSHRRAARDLPPLPGAERARVRGRLRLRHRPRPAAGRDDRLLSKTRARTGSGAGTSTSRRRTGTCSTSSSLRSGATTRPSSTCASTCRRPTDCRPVTSGRRRSIRWRRRTWRCHPRMRRTSSTSSGSTSSGRC